MSITSIVLDEKSKEILDKQPRSFNLSAFVRQKLEELNESHHA